MLQHPATDTVHESLLLPQNMPHQQTRLIQKQHTLTTSHHKSRVTETKWTQTSAKNLNKTWPRKRRYRLARTQCNASKKHVKQLANTTYSYGTKIMPTFRLLLAKRMLVHSLIQRARSTHGSTNTCLYWNGTCAKVGTVSFGTWNVRASGKWPCSAALHVGQRAKRASVLLDKIFRYENSKWLKITKWHLVNGSTRSVHVLTFHYNY